MEIDRLFLELIPQGWTSQFTDPRGAEDGLTCPRGRNPLTAESHTAGLALLWCCEEGLAAQTGWGLDADSRQLLSQASTTFHDTHEGPPWHHTPLHVPLLELGYPQAPVWHASMPCRLPGPQWENPVLPWHPFS